MPYPNEHAARVADESDCGAFKRMNQGQGVSLILCDKGGKMVAVSYRFAKDKFTPAQAKEWLSKHNLRADKFEEASDEKMEAKLSMKAAYGRPEVDGRIWSSGMHHVFVNDEPSRIYVPEETIMQTFDSIRNLINTQGRMPIGIDHLSDSVLGENEILAKMNLLDVGEVTKVGTDGSSIYILDSELKNQQIKELNAMDGLPAYSIVGAMDAKPCPNGKADYVVEAIDVERVDFVEEGGCSVCKVGAQPGELILTSKKSMEDFDMKVNANDATPEPVEEQSEDAVVEEIVEETIDEIEQLKLKIKELEDKAEDKVEEVAEEVKEAVDEVAEVIEEVVEDVEEEALSEVDALKKELKEIKEMLGGKKPKVEASSAFDVDGEIDKLINAGKATPAMREALTKVAVESEDGFMAIAANMPVIVNMKMESKLAKIEEQTKKPKKTAQEEWEEQYGDLAKMFRV